MAETCSLTRRNSDIVREKVLISICSDTKEKLDNWAKENRLTRSQLVDILVANVEDVSMEIKKTI